MNCNDEIITLKNQIEHNNSNEWSFTRDIQSITNRGPEGSTNQDYSSGFSFRIA